MIYTLIHHPHPSIIYSTLTLFHLCIHKSLNKKLLVLFLLYVYNLCIPLFLPFNNFSFFLLSAWLYVYFFLFFYPMLLYLIYALIGRFCFCSYFLIQNNSRHLTLKTTKKSNHSPSSPTLFPSNSSSIYHIQLKTYKKKLNQFISW